MSRIEEVRRQSPRLGLELAKPEHAGADREVDELAPERLFVSGNGLGAHAAILSPLLRIGSITLRRAAQVLLKDASMNVHPGQKVGLVGPNGAGKSSLFAMVRGEIHADEGEVTMPPRWILSHVAQETPALVPPAIAFVLDCDL